MTQDSGEATLDTGAAHVQIVQDAATGRAAVVVNGQDLTRQLRGADVLVRADQVPLVTLYTVGSDVSFEGPGIVRVPVPPDPDVAAVGKEQVRDWLNSLDWALLQATAAEGAMAAPIGEAFRAALLDALDRDW